jgi:hypothetical protein
MADPSWSGSFYKHDLFGWTDAKHLVYDESSQFSSTYQNLISDAEADGSLIGAMSAPMKFIAWSDLDVDNLSFTPQVTLKKVWDARWLMLFSSVIILVVLGWVILGKRKSKLQI